MHTQPSLSAVRDPRTRRSYLLGSTYSVTTCLLLHSCPMNNKFYDNKATSCEGTKYASSLLVHSIRGIAKNVIIYYGMKELREITKLVFWERCRTQRAYKRVQRRDDRNIDIPLIALFTQIYPIFLYT